MLEEYQNRGAQGAQADAARAKDLGAFIDVSIIGQTQLYAEAIVSNQIVAMSPVYLSQGWHDARAPFSHSALFPTGEAAATFQAQIVCQTLNGRTGSPVERSGHGREAAGVRHRASREPRVRRRRPGARDRR